MCKASSATSTISAGARAKLKINGLDTQIRDAKWRPAAALLLR
jgi:hypothetical protein